MIQEGKRDYDKNGRLLFRNFGFRYTGQNVSIKLANVGVRLRVWGVWCVYV